MGRPPAMGQKAVERALDAVQRTDDCNTLRAAQSVLLPLLGLTLQDTAEVVGRDRHWVSRARNRMLRDQPPPSKHGGRRRFLMEEDREVALVKSAITQSAWSQICTVRQALGDLLAQQTGHAVSTSTITQLLNRAAPKVLPGGTATQLLAVAGALGRQWHYENLVSEMLGRTAD